MSKNQDRADFVRLLAAGYADGAGFEDAQSFALRALEMVKDRFSDEPQVFKAPILTDEEIEDLGNAGMEDARAVNRDDTLALLEETEADPALSTARANRYREALVEAMENCGEHAWRSSDLLDAEKEISHQLRKADTDVKAMGAGARIAAPVGPDVVEALATYAHEAWSGWMRYLFHGDRGRSTADGWLIRPEAVTRWCRQRDTPYVELPEAEKESDRQEARKMLEVMQQACAAAPVGDGRPTEAPGSTPGSVRIEAVIERMNDMEARWKSAASRATDACDARDAEKARADALEAALPHWRAIVRSAVRWFQAEAHSVDEIRAARDFDSFIDAARSAGLTWEE